MKKLIILLFSLVLALCGCAGQVEEEHAPYQVWFIHAGGTSLETRALELETEDTEKSVQFCLEALAGEFAGGEPILDKAVYVKETKIEGGSLSLTMSPAYEKLPKAREILVRAALVRTLTQLPDIYRVFFYLSDGHPLRDSKGALYGYQTAESFVENSGADLNQYQYVTLTLYFADASGSRLVKETRTVAYSTGKPLERVVVEQLLNGPEESGHMGILGETANILNATSSDRIAYVNFDASVETAVLPVDTEVTVYALVDSIIENCKDEKVQFSINGQNSVLLGGKVDLSHFFEADYSLLED